jgi:uncharacterized integral membrane protein
MRNLINVLFVLPFAIVVIVLAVANRGPVTLSLDPIAQQNSIYTLTLPLFVVLLGTLMVGIIIGGLASWVAQGRHRKAERRFRREAEGLRAEAERLKAFRSDNGPALPALPALRR